jgi:D-glycero-D-manno-heptose 1,7-bisphosphate phosphatase
MHEKMASLLQAESAKVDYIAFCPHGPDDNCTCRKPKPGMLHEIAKHFDCGLSQVTMVGDTLGDMRAAHAANANFVLVKTGKGKKVIASGELPDSTSIFANLLSYTQHRLESTNK